MARKEITIIEIEKAANELVDKIIELEKNLIKLNVKKHESEAVNNISKYLEEVYKSYETD